jgi:multisubunit Na+/H+ antiporter MnhG subunit
MNRVDAIDQKPVATGRNGHIVAEFGAIGHNLSASSFGAAFGMVRLPTIMRRNKAKSIGPADYVKWNIAWLTLAVVVGAAFIFALGPGLERVS